MDKKLRKMLFNQNDSIMEALAQLNQPPSGRALFITNENNQLCGVITDGDIRRAILRNVTLETPVKEILSPDYKFIYKEKQDYDYLKSLEEKIAFLPVVNEKKEVVDCYSFEYRTPIPIAKPLFTGNESKYVNECIATNWISSKGKFVREFEERFAAFCEVKYGVSTCNGTAALHLALAAYGIKGGDEVIVPSLTFIATANAVTFTGAKPVFVDSSLDTWGMDPMEVKKVINSRTRAIIPVHLYGSTVDMEPVMELAKKNDIFVLEDAAEAHGAKYKGAMVGGIGHAACFSFYGNKIVTTGEGGMVVTNNSQLAEKMRVLRDHGMDPNKKYWHPFVGYNYRMTNLQAAIGCAQMEKINHILDDKKRIERGYLKRLKNLPGIRFQPKQEYSENVTWMFSVLFDEDGNGSNRDRAIALLKEKDIEANPFFYPIHKMPPYTNDNKLELINAEHLSARGLNLPSYTGISEYEMDRVCQCIQEVLSVNA